MSLREILSDYWYAFQQRLFPRLEGELGARHVRVHGYDKVLAHLMFGMTVLTASQLMRLNVSPI